MALFKIIFAYLLLFSVSLDYALADDEADDEKENATNIFGVDNHEYEQGAQVINAILTNMWPSMGKDILGNMRSNPVLAGPYLLKLKGGKLRYAPKIRNIKMLSTTTTTTDTCNGKNETCVENPLSSPPPRFECGILYKGRPDIELVLTSADGYKKNDMKNKARSSVTGFFKKLARKLMPDILIDINSVNIHARVEVELDMVQKKIVFFFVEQPNVEWDLEINLSESIDIPMFGENKLDSILSSVLAGIDKENPIRVKF